MTKEEIKNTPELVDFMLDKCILADSRTKVHKRLEEVCNLAINALEQISDLKEAYNKGYKDGQEAFAVHLELCKEEQEPYGKDINVPATDAISREAVDELSKELVHTTRDKADFLCNFWEGLRKLPPVTPKPKTGHWILQPSNKEQGERDFIWWKCFICSECQCSDIHAKGTKVPYCWNCGAKMSEIPTGSESEEV